MSKEPAAESGDGDSGDGSEAIPLLSRPIIHVLLLAAMLLAITLPSLSTRDLWNPDEPRYMEVAREMVVLCEPVVPHLNGEPYDHKPPMFFWLTGGLWRAGFGFNSGRVVTILATFVLLLIVYAGTRRALGPEASLLASVITLTTAFMLHFGKLGVIDPLLSLFVTASILLGFSAMHTADRGRRRCWLGAYLAAGLAVLTKGPVGLAIPLLVLLVYGLWNRRRVSGGGAVHLAGVCLLLIVVGSWVLPAIMTGGEEYRHAVLIEQNAGRATGAYGHKNPFYYYMLIGPLMFFPWCLPALGGVRGAIRPKGESEQGDLLKLAFVWGLAPVIFLSLVPGKRINYILPIVPSAGILAAWFLMHVEPRWKEKVFRLTCLCAAAPAAVCALALTLFMLGLEPAWLFAGSSAESARQYFAWPLVAAVGLMLATVIGTCLLPMFVPRGERLKRGLILATGFLLLSPVYDMALAPYLNTLKSARPFSEASQARAGITGRIFLYRRQFSGMYNLYTGRARMPVIKDKAELARVLADPENYVIADARDVLGLVRATGREDMIVLAGEVGHRRMVLMRSWRHGDDEPKAD